MRYKYFGLFLVIIIFYGCTNNYCPEEEVSNQISEMGTIWEKYDDAIDLASSTSRISLSQPINNLQEIKREMSNLEVAECLIRAKDFSVISMENTIDGFLAFIADEPDSIVAGYFSDSTFYINEYIYAIYNIQDCMPKCKYEDIWGEAEQ